MTKHKKIDMNYRLAGIIRQQDLLRPMYYPTAAYGHIGRDDLALPREDTANGGERP